MSEGFFGIFNEGTGGGGGGGIEVGDTLGAAFPDTTQLVFNGDEFSVTQPGANKVEVALNVTEGHRKTIRFYYDYAVSGWDIYGPNYSSYHPNDKLSGGTWQLMSVVTRRTTLAVAPAALAFILDGTIMIADVFDSSETSLFTNGGKIIQNTDKSGVWLNLDPLSYTSMNTMTGWRYPFHVEIPPIPVSGAHKIELWDFYGVGAVLGGQLYIDFEFIKTN